MNTNAYYTKYIKYKQKYKLVKNMNGGDIYGSLLYADEEDPTKGCLVSYPKHIIGSGATADVIKGYGCAVKQHKHSYGAREYNALISINNSIKQNTTYAGYMQFLHYHVPTPIAYDKRYRYFATSLHGITLYSLLMKLPMNNFKFRHAMVCSLQSIIHDILKYCDISHFDLKTENILCDANEYGCIIPVIGDWGMSVKYDKGTLKYSEQSSNDLHTQYVYADVLNPYVRTTSFLVSPLAMMDAENFIYLNTIKTLREIGCIRDMFALGSSIINVHPSSIQKHTHADSIDHESVLYKIFSSTYHKSGTVGEQYKLFNQQVEYLCWDINENNKIIHTINDYNSSYFTKYPNNILSLIYKYMNELFTIDHRTYTVSCVPNEQLKQCISRCYVELKRMCNHKTIIMLNKDIYEYLKKHNSVKKTGFMPDTIIIFYEDDDLVYTKQEYRDIHVSSA